MSDPVLSPEEQQFVNKMETRAFHRHNFDLRGLDKNLDKERIDEVDSIYYYRLQSLCNRQVCPICNKTCGWFTGPLGDTCYLTLKKYDDQ